MSLLSTYRTLLTEELGTAETTFATQTKRDRAIVQATRWIGNNYKVPDLLFQESITFDSSGLADIPARFNRNNLERIYETTGNTTFTFYRDPGALDFHSRGVAIDYDISSGARKLRLEPAEAKTLIFRYYLMVNPISDASDDSGLPIESDIAVAKYAASLILRQKGKEEEAQLMLLAAESEANLWAASFSDTPGRITSVYEGTAYLQDGTNVIRHRNIF